MNKLPDPVAWHYERDTDTAISFAPDRDDTKHWQGLYSESQVKELLAQAAAARIAAQTENEELKGRLAKSGLDARRKYEPVLKLALEALVESCGARCNAEYNPCHARLAATAIRKVLG